MNLLYSVLILLFVFCANSYAQRRFNTECCEEYCYTLDDDKPQVKQFATKTAYEIIRGNSDARRQFYVPNCKPVKFWILARHGTRNPSAANIQRLRELPTLRDEIIDNYEVRKTQPDRGGLCEGDLQALKHWSWNQNLTEQYKNDLTYQGWEDMKGIAIRYKRIFPEIFDGVYDSDKYIFRHTDSQRTQASFRAFVEGLFGQDAHLRISPIPPSKNDTLLEPYDQCPAWEEASKNAEGPNSEYTKFANSSIFQQTIEDISKRLGFKFSRPVRDILDIFDMCRFDLAWKLDSPSPWCAAFTFEQVKVLEYYIDLKEYYENSYGTDINGRIMCEAMRDMLNHLDSPKEPTTAAYFAHKSSILLLISAMGAYQDGINLRVDNFDQLKDRRKWKTSELSPFASNLAAVKYDCPNEQEKTKIIFFLNEKAIDLTWCRVGLCDWTAVKRQFSHFFNAECSAMHQSTCYGAASSIRFSITLGLTVLIMGVLKFF